MSRIVLMMHGILLISYSSINLFVVIVYSQLASHGPNAYFGMPVSVPRPFVFCLRLCIVHVTPKRDDDDDCPLKEATSWQ